ncbi:HmuY family protein [Porphyromonas levii]|uniref:HmuY family protein n=1 Tax=Porphyromonas levii TaxID=28114 RepID=UPI00035F1D16|nr:HmuY family protein [Porphyromonas levii]
MKKITTTFLIGLALLGFSSCKGDKKDTPQTTEVKTVVIDASNYGKFVYFSFEKGTVVTVSDADYNNNLGWDIAFRGHYPRTNGGASGKGQGGVIKTKELTFGAVMAIPAGASWEVDKSIRVAKVNDKGAPIMPPQFEMVPGNVLLQSWLASGGHPPHKYDNSIFLVKGANGKIAKVQMVSFENKHITMRYEYPFTPTKK